MARNIEFYNEAFEERVKLWNKVIGANVPRELRIAKRVNINGIYGGFGSPTK